MLWVAPMRGSGDHDGSRISQLPNDFSRLFKPPHLSVAGCKKAARRNPAWSFLQRPKQNRPRLLKLPKEEMRNANPLMGQDPNFAWTEPNGGFKVPEGEIGVTSPKSTPAAPSPPLAKL
jgi:hypothetical protein